MACASQRRRLADCAYFARMPGRRRAPSRAAALARSRLAARASSMPAARARWRPAALLALAAECGCSMVASIDDVALPGAFTTAPFTSDAVPSDQRVPWPVD